MVTDAGFDVSRTTMTYDLQGLLQETDAGHPQVLAEKTTQGTWVAQSVVYTLGHDLVGQWTSSAIGPPGDEGSMYIPTGSHVLLRDGHGSTRLLATAITYSAYSSPVHQNFTFDAYGRPIGFDPAMAATTLLYSGEQFDPRINMQYLRARYYNPATRHLQST